MTVHENLPPDKFADSVYDFENYPFIDKLEENIKYFEEQINKTKISNFFDVLYQILMNFENRGNEFFQKIFENICKRIHIEVERHYRLKFKVKKEKNKAKKRAAEKRAPCCAGGCGRRRSGRSDRQTFQR